MRRRLLCLAAVLALVALPACSDDDSGGDGDAATTTSSTGSTAPPPATTEVVMHDFRFEPATVEVSSGGGVRLVNRGNTRHTFTVDSLNVDQEVAPGSQVEALVPSLAGEVRFYCRFHEGMEGTLKPKA